MKKMMSLVLVILFFTGCEKEGIDDPAKKLEPPETPVVYSPIEIQFTNWEKVGDNYKIFLYWINNEIELTFHYYGNGSNPTSEEIESKTFTYVFDSLTYGERTKCDGRTWDVANLTVSKKEGWYLIDTRFLYGLEYKEYTDTIKKCYYVDAGRLDMIHVGVDTECYTNDFDPLGFE